MAFVSLLLVGILVFLAANEAVVVCYDIGGGAAAGGGGGGGVNMEEDELFGLFEVMGSLLEDPTWAQMHPFPCTDTPWPGVECELDLELQTSVFHVTKIHIGPDILTPPCCKASAKIPHTHLPKLPYLKTLALISCFTKSPASLTKSLFGSSSSSSSLPFLEHLSLQSNPSLTGEIPSTISNLASLKILRVSQNNLTGQIPREIGKLVNLQQLDLSHSNLTGPIPEEIGKLGNLAILDLSWNCLQEVIPVSIGGLYLLEKIDLSFNKLQGDLPWEFGGLKRLVLLDLSHNMLTGTQIPDNFSGLQQLQYLIMDHNPLNASFPLFVGSLSKLSVLSFSGCGLNGPILTTFSKLRNLGALCLDNNRLNGSVPTELGLLPSLDMLNLSRNELSGEVLFSGEFINRVGERLDLGENNGLCISYDDDDDDDEDAEEMSWKFLEINPICIFPSSATNKTLAEKRPKLYKGDDDKGSNANHGSNSKYFYTQLTGLIMICVSCSIIL